MKHLDPSLLLARDAFAAERANSASKLSKKAAVRFQKSMKEVGQRKESVPKISYLSNLPIRDSLSKIESLLKSHQVLIVAGETGSGKTTQISLACLKAGLGVRGMIGHTQPRRLAARSVATRIASVLGVELGNEVGYAVRFEDRVNPNTLVKVVTDGLLLTEIRHDRYLASYDTVIVDEAHERSLNIDFLLGYLKTLLARRKDLRVVVTSATIDVEAFSQYFDGAPIVRVEGRSYPVDVRYRPVDDEIEEAVKECVEEIASEQSSKIRDVLMFLSGEREILEWSHWFRKNYPEQFEVLPLYARLPPKEQAKIFAKSDKQRVLLTTNVAETSLTVPNIRYVIDMGNARISRYSLQSRIQRLPIEPISQASANQRAGRCGRLAPGICFRLYDEHDFQGRSEYSIPEIRRTNLASVVLQMLLMNLGDIADFPFLDPPDSRAITSAKRSLQELGATRDGNLTEIGRQMAVLPVDPRLARMLIEANVRKSLTEVLIIVAALAAQDPRLRPLDKRQLADKAHSSFVHPQSDFLTFVNLWQWAERERQAHSRGKFRRQLESVFVSPTRYLEWRSLHRQLLLACTRLGMKLNKRDAELTNVHLAILSGSLSFIGLRVENDTYLGLRNLKFRLFPGSALAKRKPKWIVAAEIAETTQTFARCLAPIEPRWLEQFAKELFNYHAHDPFWDSKSGKALVLLDASLSGLPVYQNSRVDYSDFDWEGARRLFVRHALIGKSAKIDVAIVKANRGLVRSLEEIQNRERRRNVVVDESRLIDFYLSKLPEQVCDVSSFRKWYSRSNKPSREALRMSMEDILLEQKVHLRSDAFPSELHFDGVAYPLKYRFSPGDADDGISIQVPLHDLNCLNQEALEWLVPGFLESKCLELVRSLPKQLRKKLVPVSDRVEKLLPTLLEDEVYRSGNLFASISRCVGHKFGFGIDGHAWDPSKLSPHLLMNIQVVDGRGRVIDQDRDLQALRDRTSDQSLSRLDSTDISKFELKGVREFPSKGIEWSRKIATPKGPVVAYAHIVDRREAVDITMSHESGNPTRQSLMGMCRLVYFAEHQSVKYLSKLFDQYGEMQMQWISVGKVSDLKDAVLLKAIEQLYFRDRSLPTTRVDFERMLEQERGKLVESGTQLLDLVAGIVKERYQIVLSLEALKSRAYEIARRDILDQIDSLITQKFPLGVDFDRLSDIPRYLKGIQTRISNLPGKVNRDNALTNDIQAWDLRLASLREQGYSVEVVERLFHLVQELRLSLFCQGVRTRIRVSAKRLEEEFVRVEQNRPQQFDS